MTFLLQMKMILVTIFITIQFGSGFDRFDFFTAYSRVDLSIYDKSTLNVYEMFYY